MEKRTMGSFLAALRKANGMTQKELAERLNVSDKAVSRWERDECTPDLSLIPVIGEIFDVTADELICGERKKNAAESGGSRSVKLEKELDRILRAPSSAAMGCLLGNFYGRLAEGGSAVLCCGIYSLPACFMGGKDCLGQKRSCFSFQEGAAFSEPYLPEIEMLPDFGGDFGGAGLFDYGDFLPGVCTDTGG